MFILAPLFSTDYRTLSGEARSFRTNFIIIFRMGLTMPILDGMMSREVNMKPDKPKGLYVTVRLNGSKGETFTRYGITHEQAVRVIKKALDRIKK